MMRAIFSLVFMLVVWVAKSQPTAQQGLQKDSLIVIPKNPAKGFQYDYLLFLPKGLPIHKTLVLLVEPNNTGKLSDSIEVHKNYAIALASVSSVGNNISTELKIPLLVPVFPRPASHPLIYTHALDRETILGEFPALIRPDLQLIEMIKDAKARLLAMNIPVEKKIFMNGFSASATFTNRFSFLHPELIKALAIGGFNGELMLPQTKINKATLNYPLGINDFTTLFGKTFDKTTYASIPQFIYMGELDDNDAVQFDDAYTEAERKIINTQLGKEVQARYIACQKLYQTNKLHPVFKTFEKVGHWTTSDVNLAVILFFLERMKEK